MNYYEHLHCMSIYFYCMILVWLILCLIQKALLASSEKVIQKDETSALSSDSKWGNDQKLTQTLVNNEFKLQDRIDFLGYIKIYDSDDKVSRFIDSQQGVIIEIVEESSYRMDLPSIDLTFSDTKAKTEPKEHLPSSVLRIVSIESGTDVFQDVDSSAESIVVLGDERYMQFNSSCIRNGTFCLHSQIFRGGHGEIFRGTRISEKDGTEDRTQTVILKRMLTQNKPHIRLAAEREVYFGTLLRGQLNMPRLVKWFEGENDEFWLVYRDEGISLQQLFYAMTVDSESVTLSPSNVWRRFRLTAVGRQSMRTLMHQIIEHVSRLHAQGIVHRDLKLSNILLNTEGDQPRLVVNDFSSAVSEEALRRGLYGDQGPTQQELSLQYAPPEVRLSSDSHFSFDLEVPESYDIWSVGIIFLEILLGTGDVFEVEDQRTAAIIRHRLYSSRQRVDTSPDGNQDKLLSDALFLASLSEFCIFQSYSNFKDESSTTSDLNPNEPNNVDSDFTIIKYSDSNTDLIETSEFKVDNRLTKSLQSKSAMACKAVESSSIMSVSQPHLHSFTENNKSLQVTSPRLCESFETIRKHIQPLLQSPRCGQETLRRLLLKKDSLGVGFDDRWGLDLLTRLLQFEPNLRMPLSEALLHAYFVGPYRSSVDDSEHATAAERDIYDERNNVSVGGTAASSPAILATARRRVPASSATTSTASSTIINCTIDDDNRICGSTEMESSFAGNVETDEVDYVSLWLELDNLEAVANNDSTTDESDLFSLDTKFIAEPEESNAFPLWELLNVSYFCPRCHRHFSSYESCITHARARRHGSRCQFTYNSSFLPSCTTEHSLTPADPHSGWCDLQGRRGYLEDRHGLDIRENYSFYGVYDGHFGSRTARFTARHLPTSFYEAITKPGADVEFDLSSVNSSFLALNAQNFHILDHINNQSRQHWASTIQLSDDEDIVTNIDDKLVTVKEIRSSMRSAYLQTDSLFLQVISGTKEISGTTATTIALFPNHIVVGNVGDSRAVLCCNVDGGPILLTEDHTASSAREVTRVLSRGGWFSAPSPGSHSPSRVNDRLAVTRSLGDFAMKPDIVIADPDVIVISRTQPTLESKENGLLSTHNRINNNLHSERPLPEPNSCILYKELLQSLSNERHSSGEDNSQNSSISSQLFVIIASDGVWDEVSLSDSVDIVCEQLHADLLLYRSTMNISTSILHASDEKSLNSTWSSMHSANLFHRAAKRLTEEALLRGSSDNIGTCVIDLVSF